MKIAFATTCTDIYAEYLRVFLKSIIKNNHNFDIPVYVFTNSESLSEENRIKLLSTYEKIIFHEVNHDTYETFSKGNVKYYSIECFRLPAEFDKVVYFGCDVLCLRTISPLLQVCEEIEDIGMTREKRRPCFNNNCMIIDRKHINADTYYQLIEADYSKIDTYGTDQKLFNCYFAGKIKEIQHKFNVLVTEVNEIKEQDIIFLHYIHKPLSEKGRKNLSQKQINLWESYRNG